MWCCDHVKRDEVAGCFVSGCLHSVNGWLLNVTDALSVHLFYYLVTYVLSVTF